jgi:hypothetical protein
MIDNAFLMMIGNVFLMMMKEVATWGLRSSLLT